MKDALAATGIGLWLFAPIFLHLYGVYLLAVNIGGGIAALLFFAPPLPIIYSLAYFVGFM